jgi:hypothetical protein
MSTPHIPELAEALQRRTLALFLGADLPREVTGLPSRADLARDLARRKGLDESLSLAEVAQRVSQAGNRWEFTDFIRNALDTAGRSPQPFHQGIVALVQEYRIETLITTAYDNLLELAFQQAGVGLNRVVRGGDVGFINPDRPTLFRLYGDAQQPDTLVVTDRDHSDLLRDRDKEPLLEEVRRAFRHNTVLFLGYNLADPDFRFLFDQVAASRFARTAYAVWPGLPEVDVRMWRDRGIVILDTDPLGILSETVSQPTRDERSEPTVTLPSRLAPSIKQLNEARANLRLIEEREAEYVLSTDVPLQLIKEKRQLQQRIAELEAQLAETVPTPEGTPMPELDESRAVVALDVRHGARVRQLFEQELINYGYVVKQLSAPLTAQSFSEARVLIFFVSAPDDAGQALLPEELASIHSFVTYGGSLFLIGLGWVWKQYGQKQGLTMDDYPLNRIASHYGIYFRGEPLDAPLSEWDDIGGYPCARFSAMSMKDHPICEGLQTIASFGMSSTLQVAPPAIPLIWDGNDTDRCILAVWEGQRRGRVVCLQHEGYFVGEDVNGNGVPNIYEYDNKRLLLNIVQWLSQSDRQPPTTTSTLQLSKGDGEPSGPAPTFGTGNRWAVLVGVNEYQDETNYGQLHVCVKDVHAIREQLIGGGFDPDRIRLLTDQTVELPTKANILVALKAVADATEPDDLLLFYYSGHGDETGGESYLVARDGRRLVLGDTAVSVSRVKEIMEGAAARAKVIVLDACHSGADIGGKGPRPMSAEFIRRVFEQAEGLAILASCKQGQLSYEWGVQERSVFTHFLLKALTGEADRDGKGFITVQDASRHVVDGVKLWASQNNASQTPTLQCTVAGDIILVRYQ